MTAVTGEMELLNACQVLFGSELQVSRSFLEYIQLSGIKSAYRKKAMETHPDMSTGRNGADLFMAVQQAYENLVNYIEARKHGFTFQSRPVRAPQRPSRPAYQPCRSSAQRPKARPYTHQRSTSTAHKQHQSGKPRNSTTYKTNGATRSTNKFYQGSIPNRKLLFGHYLYYTGITNWQTIIKALVWQRTDRPRLGELGCRFGWLSSQDILRILKNRNLSDPFGKSALHMGLLTREQLRLLLFQQKRLQKKFGQYFINNNLLTREQLAQLVNQFRAHNLSVGTGRSYHGNM